MIYLTTIAEKCTPGNECRQTVENATEIKSMKEDVKYIRTKIDNLVLGVAGSVILMLINFVWQLTMKG